MFWLCVEPDCVRRIAFPGAGIHFTFTSLTSA
jgi:hypothetical protein